MKKKFKDLTERHDRTIAEFLVNELVKFNLDSVFMEEMSILLSLEN